MESMKKINEQLRELQKIGIQVNEGITEELLLEELDEAEYVRELCLENLDEEVVFLKDFDEENVEEDPYILLLIAMGGEVEIEEDNWIDVSDDVWHLDTECIEDTGDYVRIAERIKSLSKGLLELENIRDVVDIEEEEASLTFTLDGKEYHWEFEVDNDWLDGSIFDRFNELLAQRKIEKRIMVLALDQDCLVGIYSPEQLKQLNSLLGTYAFE